ncbi:kinetochore-associated protein DSN1 homolog isoform X3 [Poecile atricapillus]|uniref:kinetochore-associated protein DSN1 homolog isoform X3 n=1 Tax=Poecile atricapillus TaxID=48891 RepID=UPI002738F541|nr:kinetochore-associated protein DSN1 homolog isoform X3 [Poecile atricapillus]
MAAKPERALRMRNSLRAGGRRETAMAEAAAEPGGSPGPAAVSSSRGSAGPQEGERCPGGPSPESGGAAPDPEPAADPEAISKLPRQEKKLSPSSRKRRAESSQELLNSSSLSPISAAPQDKIRFWHRSDLERRRSRRKSLPPVHQDITDLSQSISLELPEVQRLFLLLLSSFKKFGIKDVFSRFYRIFPRFPLSFLPRSCRRIWKNPKDSTPRLSLPEIKTEEFRRLLQRLLLDGTLEDCVEPPPGDSLDPAMEASVVQMKERIASVSGELQAWDQLLDQHQQRSQEASRNLEQLRAGDPPWPPPQIPNSQIPSSKPDYGEILARQIPLLQSLQLLVDEALQATKLVLEFQKESREYLRELSEQLASRTFGNLPGSPARRLLQRKPQRAPAEEE